MSLTTPRVHDSAARRAGVAGGAIASAGAVWLGARALGIELVVEVADRPPEPVSLPITLIFAAQAALAGWALLAVLERVSRHAHPIWTTTAAVVLVASLVPIYAVEASAGTRVSLTAMHLVVGGVLIAGLARKPAGTEAVEVRR